MSHTQQLNNNKNNNKLLVRIIVSKVQGEPYTEIGYSVCLAFEYKEEKMSEGKIMIHFHRHFRL